MLRSLRIGPNAIINEPIRKTLLLLDKYFTFKKHSAVVTSGIRSPEDQLRIIKQYADKNNITFPEWDKYINLSPPTDLRLKVLITEDKMNPAIEGKRVYWWARVWSALLNKGIIISPIFTAEVLYDYYKDGINKKGFILPPSNHIKGKAFDIDGSIPEYNIVKFAMAIDSEVKKKIRSVLLERNNNCVHCNIA